MRYSGIGGQAVMEGIMMKNGDRYAVAVRKPDQEIHVETSSYSGFGSHSKYKNLPVVRGIFRFIESLSLGIRTLSYSASFFEDGQEMAEKDKKKEEILTKLTVAGSILAAIGLFMVLPYAVSLLFGRLFPFPWMADAAEGILRLFVFLGYVAGISLMPEIRRVYMYHGAEHKCINCIENGMELTVENVRKSSRLHKRCGTSFLLAVMLVSILFFLFIRVDSVAWRFVLRLLFIPAVAGVSYEWIRFAGRSDLALVNFLSRPGLLLQKITTREPDDGMIEVGIASVEAVFDWKSYQNGQI